MEITLANQMAKIAQQDQRTSNAEKISKSPEKDGKIAKVSKEFESLFLDMVLQSMRKTVGKSEFMDGGNAEEIYRSMLDSEYAKQMASTEMTGLAKNIEQQLKAIDRKSSIQQYAK